MVDRVHCVHMQGRFCLYKLTEEDEDAWDELAETGLYRVSRGIPSNNSIQVLIRVYVVSVRRFTFLQIKSRLLKLGIYLWKKMKHLSVRFKHLRMCDFCSNHQINTARGQEIGFFFSFCRRRTCTQLTRTGKRTPTLSFGLARMKLKTEIITSPNS